MTDPDTIDTDTQYLLNHCNHHNGKPLPQEVAGSFYTISEVRWWHLDWRWHCLKCFIRWWVWRKWSLRFKEREVR